MTYKTILSIGALAGALATTTTLAHAEHPDQRGRDRIVSPVRGEADVIDSANLRAGRGEVTFRFTSGQRRDGLMLSTSARDLRILGVDLQYSDGLVEQLRGRELRLALTDDGTAVIQRGRPPGLRAVRVSFALPRSERRARLELIQIHDGDGYTSEADLRHDRDGVVTWRASDFEGRSRYDRYDRYDRSDRYDDARDDDRRDDRYDDDRRDRRDRQRRY